MMLDWSLILISVASLSLTVCLFLQRMEISRLKKKFQCDLKQVNSEMKGVSSTSVGVGQRMMQIDAEFRNLMTKVDEMMRDDPSRVSYSEASRLVGLGAEVEDLVGSCGLSKPEAQLVQAVYGKKGQAIGLNA